MVALVIGTLLNLINQPQAVLDQLYLHPPAMQSLDLVMALLTYGVSFLVADHGVVNAIAHQRTDS